MNIYLDFTPAIQNHAGVGRYTEQLARALVGLHSGDQLSLFYTDALGRSPAPPLDALPRRSLRLSNKLWRLRVLLSSYANIPMDSLFGDTDVFHATDHLLPTLRRMRSVFTLYDLSFLTYPETHLPLNRWFLRLMMPRFLRFADAIICISQHTRADAVRFYGVDDSKTSVIPLGVDTRFCLAQDLVTLGAVRARYNLPGHFILFASTIEPRKNLVTLLEAYKVLRAEGRNEKLVVVGRKGWRYEATFMRLRELGLENQVVFLGSVPDEDLPAIYSAADVFVYPSLYEGFGLPPLEAMASGCPVICSNTSSLPEVCGDAALLIPPTDVSALASALQRVLDEPVLREDLRARGLRQSAKFSWEVTAKKTLDVYRTVAEASPISRS